MATIFMFVGIGLFLGSLLLAGVVIAVLGKSRDSYQQPTPEGILCFRKPLAERILFLLFCLTFLSGPFLFSDLFLSVSATWKANRTSADANQYLLVLIVVTLIGCTFLLLCALVLRRAGPEEVRLDLAGRTFRRVSGWPLMPKASTGSMNQVAGVCLREIGTSPNRYYLVCLRWARGGEMSTVGHYERREEAEAEARKLQAATGLARV